MVTTLPRSAAGSGPVIVETERGGLLESSLTFSYIPMEVSGTATGTGSDGGGGGGGASKLTGASVVTLGSMRESPLLISKKTKQSGK